MQLVFLSFFHPSIHPSVHPSIVSPNVKKSNVIVMTHGGLDVTLRPEWLKTVYESVDIL